MQSTVDQFGRVVIPEEVREALHLTPGTALSVEQRGGMIVFRPPHKGELVPQETPLKRKGGLLVYCGEAAGDLQGAVDKHRRQRDKYAASWSSE